jgi:predicted ATPase
MRTAETSIEKAHATGHALSLCYALTLAACQVAAWVDDLTAAEYYVGILRDQSTRLGVAFWGAWGRTYQGALAIKRGDVTAGSRLLRAGFDEINEAGSASLRLIELLMAEALGRAGQIDDGLAAIEEAIDHSERTEERWLFAEFLRVKGELLLLQAGQGAAAAAEAEDHFGQALGWARGQGALAWELRTATSLARLLNDQNRSADATALLQPVYDGLPKGSRPPI